MIAILPQAHCEQIFKGICETTPGVKSYSGYVELENSINVFFWFIEARKDPSKAPLTLWLNGGMSPNII